MRKADATWSPIAACTLPTVEQPLRAAEFDDLFVDTLTEIDQEVDTRVRLSLVGAPGLVERVRELVERESRCCSFFEFTIHEFDSGVDRNRQVGVHLGIAVPPSHAGVLAAMVRGARAIREGEGRVDREGDGARGVAYGSGR